MSPTCAMGPGSYPPTSNHPRKGQIMLSSTLKRSVATLGVVAGLLAAAGPASADSNEVAIESITLTAKTLPPVDGRASVSGDPTRTGSSHR